MKQKKQFIEAKTLKGFQTALSSGKVSENQIGFIEKENLIWTRGQYYGNNIELNEEDLTKNLEGKLQFADRPYDEANFSGKGYKILRKNIGEVIDYDKIQNVRNFYAEYTPTSDIFEETYEGDVDRIILDRTNKIIYGVVGVTENVWFERATYYKNWTGTTKFNRSDYSNVDGSPLENTIYSTMYKRPYFIYKNDTFVTYDIDNGAPVKLGCVLDKTALQNENTIYVIRHDFNLNSNVLTIGSNSTLLFIGGSLSDGELLFKSGTHIVNATNDCILYKVYFNGYSALSNDNVFIDEWHDDLFAYNVVPCVPKIILTKDHTISDNAHYVQEGCYSKDNDTLIIDGDGHTINIRGELLLVKGTFIYKKHIVCQNLTIKSGTVASKYKVETVFNCHSGTFINCTYYGYSRLVSNWSYSQLDSNNNLFKAINCNLYTSSFIVEGQFDKIEIDNTVLELLEPRQYMADIISTGANQSYPTNDNAYIKIKNSKIFGGIEFTAQEPTRNYAIIDVTNCTLQYFGQTYQTTNLHFDCHTKVKIVNCICYVGRGSGNYDAIDTIDFINCTFIAASYNIYDGGPFMLRGVNHMSFIACTFTTDSNSPDAGIPIVRVNTYDNNLPEDMLRKLHVTFKHCLISQDFIKTNPIIDFASSRLTPNEEALLFNISIIGTNFILSGTLPDNKSHNNVLIGKLTVIGKTYVLPVGNFITEFALNESLKYDFKLINEHRLFITGYLTSNIINSQANFTGMLPVIYNGCTRTYISDNNNIYSIGNIINI